MRPLDTIQSEVNAWLQKRGVLGYEIALREKECARIDEQLNALDKEAAMSRIEAAEQKIANAAGLEEYLASKAAREAKDKEQKEYVDDLVAHLKQEKLRKSLEPVGKLIHDDGKNEFVWTGDRAKLEAAEAGLKQEYAKLEAEGMK